MEKRGAEIVLVLCGNSCSSSITGSCCRCCSHTSEWTSPMLSSVDSLRMEN